jgi:RimJ/RimL family protein N-acetyltransferase
MTFMRGLNCELRVLEDVDAMAFSQAVNAGLTTQHLFTGSIPMRDKDYASRWQKEREAGDILFRIMGNVGKDGMKFIGTCGLHSHREIYRSWESRFLIFDPDAVGRGIGKEVVNLLTTYAFERLNAHRVWLGVSEDNLRAVKCYLDCGYVFEGRLRDEIFYAGRYHAAIRMGALEGEWKSTGSLSLAPDGSAPVSTGTMTSTLTRVPQGP